MDYNAINSIYCLSNHQLSSNGFRPRDSTLSSILYTLYVPHFFLFLQINIGDNVPFLANLKSVTNPQQYFRSPRWLINVKFFFWNFWNNNDLKRCVKVCFSGIKMKKITFFYPHPLRVYLGPHGVGSRASWIVLRSWAKHRSNLCLAIPISWSRDLEN